MRVRSAAAGTISAVIVQRQDSPLVRGRSRFDPLSWHHRHAPVAQPVGGISLRRKAVSVRVGPGVPIKPSRPLGPTVEAAPSKRAEVSVRIRERAPAPFAKRQRHRAYIATFGGSSPSGSTKASLAQRKSARSTCERRADRYREDAPVQATTQPVKRRL